MAFAELKTAYFADFSVAAIWKNRSVDVIFDSEYGMTLDMAGNNPVATVKAIDVPGIKKGQQIVIDGATYIIQSPPQADGQGIIRLELEKQ